MSPRFVKPYRKSDKNDANEAEAICEAVTRASMRFVPIKSEAQHEVQALHRVREQLLKSRTALVNQVRGLLAEHGIVAPQGIVRARRLLLELLAEPERHGLSVLFRETLQEMAERLRFFDERVAAYDDRIERTASVLPFEHRVPGSVRWVPGALPCGTVSPKSEVDATPRRNASPWNFHRWVLVDRRQHRGTSRD